MVDDSGRAAPAGETLWVTSNGAGAIKRVNLVAGTLTTIATLEDPWELALDEEAGALWVVSSTPGTLSRVDLDDGAVTTIASGLSFPIGVAVVGGGVYVAENADHVIARVAPDGDIVDVLGTRSFQGGVAGAAAAALLSFPSSLHGTREDGVDVLYVAETGGQVVRRIELADFSSRFIVGSPLHSGALAAGSRVTLAEATLLNPQDVATIGPDLVVVGDTTVVVARP